MTGTVTGQSIIEILREIIAEFSEVDTSAVVPEARWEDVLADRFDFYGLLNGTQRCFGIEIPDDDAFEMETFGDLIAFVKSRGM